MRRTVILLLFAINFLPAVAFSNDDSLFKTIHPNRLSLYLAERDKLPDYHSVTLALVSGLILPGAGQIYNDDGWGYIATIGCIFAYSNYYFNGYDPSSFQIGLGLQLLSVLLGCLDTSGYNKHCAKMRSDLREIYFGKPFYSSEQNIIKMNMQFGISINF